MIIMIKKRTAKDSQGNACFLSAYDQWEVQEHQEHSSVETEDGWIDTWTEDVNDNYFDEE